MKTLQEVVKSVGHTKFLVGITVISIAASIVLTFLVEVILGRALSIDAWFLCVLTPSIVAPFAAWYERRTLRMALSAFQASVFEVKPLQGLEDGLHPYRR